MKRLVLITSLGLMACTAEDAGEVEFIQGTATLESRVGSFLAEYRAQTGVTEVHAQFLWTRGISGEHALRALDVWTPERELEIDVCTILDVSQPEVEVVSLELLDVGPIRVGIHEAEAVLEARRLPDIWEGVTGVVYGNERSVDSEWVSVPFYDGEEYVISAPGRELGGFYASVRAPQMPYLIRADMGEWIAPNMLTVNGDAPLSLRWETPAAPADLMFVEVTGTGGSGTRLVCRVQDDGEFHLPSNILNAVRESSESLDVTLRRVNVVDISIDGMDASEVVFAARDGFTLALP